MKVLDVQHLSKTFYTEDLSNPVLKDISFSLEQGDFVAIMGQSGSGKSTLLYNVSGMDRFTSGQVYIQGEELSKKSREELADFRLQAMGFIFQDNYLLKNLTIQDNICLPGYKLGRLASDQVEARSKDLMGKLGIEAVKDHSIKEVSGGQLQRAAICRALMNSPQILFADEPTGALNSKASREVMRIFNQLSAGGMTILLVTHDPLIASRTDRILYLKDGRLEDELLLGPFTEGMEEKARQDQTLSWLASKGF